MKRNFLTTFGWWWHNGGAAFKRPRMKLKNWLPLAAILSGTALAWKIAPVIFVPFASPVRAEPIEVAQAEPATDSNVPTGGLFVAGEDGEERIFPLKHTDVRSQITGNVARVEVTQKFTNPFDEPIEAVVDYKKREIDPKDVIFLIDTSSSMRGQPIEQAKALMRRFIEGLNPDDTFTVINFSNDIRALSPTPLANTEENRRKALQYVDALGGGGGTQMLSGIQAVLNFPEPEMGRVRNAVLLTDGYIGNEAAIIAEVQGKLKPGNRFYSFGVGSWVNRFLLDRLVDRFFRHINNPLRARVNETWQGNDESVSVRTGECESDAIDSILLHLRDESGSGRIVVAPIELDDEDGSISSGTVVGVGVCFIDSRHLHLEDESVSVRAVASEALEPSADALVLRRLEIVRADGLDEEAIANLTQYLQNAAIAPDVEGEIALEIRFRNGHAKKVLLNDEESTLTDADVSNELKRLLLSWQPPISVGNKVEIIIRIRKL